MIMNGDVYLENRLLGLILSEKCHESAMVFADETRKDEADYKPYYNNNKLIKYGKDLKGENITGEYIGVIKIWQEFVNIFKNKLQDMIEEQKHSLWWEDVLYD